MSKIELLGLIFNKGFRAAPELFRAVEKTITKYQGKYSLSKEENARLQKLLDILLQPEIKLHRTGLLRVASTFFSKHLIWQCCWCGQPGES